MRSLLLRGLLAVYATALTANNLAQAQPGQWVYRIDSRPPALIFSQGFSSEGQSPNLFDHVFANSCNEEAPASRSMWVSASGRSDSALQFAEMEIRGREPLASREGERGTWLYEISPDSSYLDVYGVFRQVIEAGRNGPTYTEVDAATLRDLLYAQHVDTYQEVVTPRIYPSHIFSAVFVTLSPQTEHAAIVENSIVTNAGYQQPATQPLDHVDNLPRLVPPGRPTEFVRMRHPVMELCFMECDGAYSGARASERKRRSLLSGEPYCKAAPSASQLFIGSEDE
ncbi:hypothetical protein ACVW0Y_000884 [Pseudomonas sp. TE3786]